MYFANRYEAAVGWIVSLCPWPDKFAHTYAGLAIWLGVALIFRLPLRSWTPLAVVFAIELVNECVDRVAHGTWAWHDTLGDVAATMFWPIILVAALRRAGFLRG